jgi:hypothetical protein
LLAAVSSDTLRYHSDIEEASVARPRSDRAVRLLLKALDSLPERERSEVLRALLSGVVSGSADPGLRHLSASFAPFEPQIGTQASRQLEQPLLVRLPSSLHTRLRRWATDHGFSMAAVVRGLIERFLDEEAARGSPG